jgi:peroxiredoxin
MLKSKKDSLINVAEKLIEGLDAKALPLTKAYIAAHANSPLAAQVLEENRYTLTEADQRELLNAAGPAFKAYPGIQQMVDHLAVLAKVAVGKHFLDIEMPNPDGKTVKLSDYAGKGKLVLLDFWASWCPPCRRSMPGLRKLYAQYKNKGFEIVGISLDRNVADWKKGIADLQITWPQMSDVKFWKSAGAALYGVNSIPHTVLIGKDGTIVANNLEGDELASRVAELLKK